LCPRLVAFREKNREKFPDHFNNPVPSFGDPLARLVIVGLAPGLHGANKTGRPFTGDYAGQLLYATLRAQGLAEGGYAERADDGLQLKDCVIVNSVRCVPPENKPTPAEIKACRPFLEKQLAALPNARAVLLLGRIAHENVCRVLGIPAKSFPFAHGTRYQAKGLALIDSFHCSRLNTNTGVLTADMFGNVVGMAKEAAQAPAELLEP
jgi:uracil-DNA glycosylase family 4